MKELAGRTAVVTGAAGGIGLATATALAAQGCHLALVDVNQSALDVAAATISRGSGARTTTHRCDVADRDAVESLAAAVVAAHGSCHILVNNAGVTIAGRFVDESLDDTSWLVGVNVWGVVHGCHAFLPALVRSDRAHIVNISSMVGLMGLPQNASYALTKGAVRMFSESLRGELRSSGVGVTVVHPGAIDTDIIQAARGSGAAKLQRLHTTSPRLRRVILTSPDRVARAVVRGIRYDRPRLVVGPDARLLDAVARVAPSRTALIGRLLDRVAGAPDLDPTSTAASGADPGAPRAVRDWTDDAADR